MHSAKTAANTNVTALKGVLIYDCINGVGQTYV
jgi:hypothetical protein